MASDDALRPRRTARPCRVAVASDQHLVSESVRTALRDRDYEVMALRWPAASVSGPRTPRARTRGDRASDGSPDVGVLLSDLTLAHQSSSARALINGSPVPWLVLAGVPCGPVWGALYDSGATLVVSTTIGLDDLCGLIEELRSGRVPSGAARRHDLVDSWRVHARGQHEISTRIATLTAREEEVLEQISRGQTVRTISQVGGVTEATVRSQVKAILRKLGVNSQLAAVAAFQTVASDTCDPLDERRSIAGSRTPQSV